MHVVYPRVYAVGHESLSQEAQWTAAVLAGGSRALLSHRSAATLHGFWNRHVPRIEILGRYSSRSSHGAPIAAHRRVYALDDATVARGVATTTVMRTIADLASVLSVHWLARAISEADYLYGLDESELVSVIERVCIGSTYDRASYAMAMRGYGSTGVRSSLEMRLLAQLIARGISEPRLNVCLDAGEEVLEVDMLWERERLCVEVDGPGHQRHATRARDAHRDRLLLAAGYTVLRFDTEAIRHDIDTVVLSVRDALADRATDLGVIVRP